MDGEPARVRYRWGRGDPSGHGREEIHILCQAGRWSVRRIGRINTPDLPATNELHALVLANNLMTREWERLPADVSPPVAYGARLGRVSRRR